MSTGPDITNGSHAKEQRIDMSMIVKYSLNCWQKHIIGTSLMDTIGLPKWYEMKPGGCFQIIWLTNAVNTQV